MEQPSCDIVASLGSRTTGKDLCKGESMAMKQSCVACMAWCIVAGTAAAQNPRVHRTEPQAVESRISLGDLTPTPEMWFYQQEMRHYKDPKMAVRRKAELRAMQREQRLAAMKWFGLSNSRPMASHTPFAGSYSPAWRSNGYYPFHWEGRGHTHTVIVPGAAYTR